MASDTLTCAAGVTPERLSALRDEALVPDDAQRLRAHIAECAACRSRLADYDTLATALRQRRELEPGERIVEGVRAQLATGAPPRRLRVSRRMWAGLATLVPVAAIILLFVYVFSGLASRGQPATANTPTVAAPTPVPTNQYGKPIYPTATPALVSLPPMTASISATTAWGAFNPAVAFITTLGGQTFVPQAMASDGRTLVGLQEPAVAPSNGATTKITLGTYDAQSHQFTAIGPTWDSADAAGGALFIDERYIVYEVSSAPGATCGECNQTLWAYDRQSESRWEFDPGIQQNGVNLYGGVIASGASADHVAFMSIQGQVWIADLPARQVKLALPVGAQPATASTVVPEIHVLGFNWPYLIYTIAPTHPNSTTPTTLDILNAQTGVNSTTSAPLGMLLGAPGGVSSSAAISVGLTAAVVSGDSLYLTTTTSVNGVNASGAAVHATYGTLYSVSGILTGGGQPQALARWEQLQSGVGGPVEINDRLITLGNGYVWDRSENRLVYFVMFNTQGASGQTQLSLSGNYLLAIAPMPANYPQYPPFGAASQGVVYDTTQYPVR